ncbi:class II fumarate hydratase [bacterium]|nr:class II fumarate hydratase [bacterium]
MSNNTSSPQQPLRVERDSMGEMSVPTNAYWGASTQRAVLNFPISNLRFSRSMIKALALIKLAAAKTNAENGDLPKAIAAAIVTAAQEVADGAFDQHFVVDIFQTGSGTSTNMNANEVIARRAGQHLADTVKVRSVHPNDHVNMGQSSNDVIPTAIHLAALLDIKERLLPALRELSRCLGRKAKQFDKIIKTGRTHLQDATPITLGQEFLGYKGQVDNAIKRLRYAQNRLSQVALGGTAVGTGINTKAGFAKATLSELSLAAGVKVKETSNHFQAQSSIDEIVDCSGVLKTIATSIYKIANDVRWMGSGPRAGLAELVLPAVQPGSSIMPGKVNPVICESTMQVCFKVIGNDATVTLASQASSFELNVAMPVAAHCLLESITLLAAASANFSGNCLKGLTATANGPALVERGLALCTALAPVVGYDLAADIAKEAAQSGETILLVAQRKTSLSLEELSKLLDPFAMTKPGAKGSE